MRTISGFSPIHDLSGVKSPDCRCYDHLYQGSPGSSAGKNLPANAEAAGDAGFNPWVRGEGNGNPLQYSGLGNPMDRGAWWQATIHRIAKSQTQLNQLSTQVCMHTWSGNLFKLSVLYSWRSCILHCLRMFFFLSFFFFF